MHIHAILSTVQTKLRGKLKLSLNLGICGSGMLREGLPAPRVHPECAGAARVFIKVCVFAKGLHRVPTVLPEGAIKPIRGALWRGVTFKGPPHVRTNFCKLFPATRCTVTGAFECSFS